MPQRANIVKLADEALKRGRGQKKANLTQLGVSVIHELYDL